MPQFFVVWATHVNNADRHLVGCDVCAHGVLDEKGDAIYTNVSE